MKSNIQKNIAKVTMPLAMVAPMAYAQNTTENETEANLGVTTVTGDFLNRNQISAFKTGTALIDVPQSLSVFTQKQIQEQGITSIADIVDYTPGLNTSQGEGHRDAVVFRGVRSTADFFVDGVRDDVQYYRSLYNVDQVEILRGPNALFFGRGGTGGVINRSLKKAQFSGNFSTFKFSLDTFGETLTQFDTNYKLDEKNALRLNLHHDKLNNHRDHYDGNRVGINPTFSHKLSDATTLNFSLEYIDHERFIDRGIPTGTNGQPVDALNDIVFGDPDLNINRLEAYVFRTSLDHKFSDSFKGNLTLGYSDFDKLYQNFYAQAYDQAATPDRVTLDGYRDTTRRKRFNLSSHFIKELATGGVDHKIIFGGEFISTKSNNARFDADWNPDPTIDQDRETFTLAGLRTLANGTGVNAAGATVSNSFSSDLNRNTEVDLTVFSLYAQDEISITDNLDFVLGVRYDNISTDVRDVKAGTDASQTDSEFSPRVGLVYKPVRNASIYASYSKSFIPSSGEQFKNLGDQLDPNTASNLEIGAKWNINDNLTASVAGFLIENTSTEIDGVTALAIEVDSEIKGVEAQIQGKVNDNWYISAGYSYLEGETTSGVRPRELPEHMFSVWNTVKVTDKFSFGLGAIYQSESLISSGSTRSLPSYFRVDAAAYYQVNEDVRLQLNVENLLDTTYYPNAHSTHQATVGSPISARLGVEFKF